MKKSTLICEGEEYPVVALDIKSEQDIIIHLLQNTNLNYYLDITPYPRKAIGSWDWQPRSPTIHYLKTKEKKLINTVYFHWESDVLPKSPKTILESLL